MIVFKEVLAAFEISAVERLARAIWTEHFSPIIGRHQVEYMLEKFQSAAAIQGYLAEGYKYYLVDFDGTSVGYIGLLAKTHKGELFLSKFYLLSDYRGKGLGRQMMENVKVLAQQNGLKKILLNTNKKNNDTIRFYEKFGFVKLRSDVIELGSGYVADDWLMEMVV